MQSSTNDIDAGLIRRLLEDQHPDLADLPLVLAAEGWDNQVWRLGGELAVRMPWATESADELLLKEDRWVPRLAPRLPLAVPVPQRLGVPSERFRHPWSVTTWVAGAPADREPVTSTGASTALADFMVAMHTPAPADAPPGRGRGGDLSEVASMIDQSMEAAVAMDLVPAHREVRAIWEDALAAPAWPGPAMWLHGDLHPANVLTEDGELVGVIDFGDLCAGDPALDLAASWILLPDVAEIERFRSVYHDGAEMTDPAVWRRARGWAVWRALSSTFIAAAGRRGEPGGKPSWGPPARESFVRLVADRLG